MNESEQNWLYQGRGLSPEWGWSFAADAPLVGLELARETGEAVVADASGSVYILDRRGQVVTLARGLHDLQEIAWSDAGTAGAVVSGDSLLTVLNRQLRVAWSYEFHAPILAVAVDPFGRHFAVCLEGGQTRILNSNRKTVGEFATARPLCHARFATTETELVAAAENGLVCCHHLDGSPVWSETWWSNIGDLSITGDGQAVFLAGLNLGIQRFDGSGNSRGTYVLEGTPNRIATSYTPKRLIASTVERGLIWLDDGGEILWATKAPDDVLALCCDPLGTGVLCGFESGRVVRLDWGVPVM